MVLFVTTLLRHLAETAPVMRVEFATLTKKPPLTSRGPRNATARRAAPLVGGDRMAIIVPALVP